MRLAQFYDLRLTGAIDVLDKTVEHLLEPSANRTLLRCVVYLFHIRTGYVPETNRQRRTGLPDAATNASFLARRQGRRLQQQSQ